MEEVEVIKKTFDYLTEKLAFLVEKEIVLATELESRTIISSSENSNCK